MSSSSPNAYALTPSRRYHLLTIPHLNLLERILSDLGKVISGAFDLGAHLAGHVAETSESPRLGISLSLGLRFCKSIGNGLGGTLYLGADLAWQVAEAAEGFWVGFYTENVSRLDFTISRKSKNKNKKKQNFCSRAGCMDVRTYQDMPLGSPLRSHQQSHQLAHLLPAWPWSRPGRASGRSGGRPLLLAQQLARVRRAHRLLRRRPASLSSRPGRASDRIGGRREHQPPARAGRMPARTRPQGWLRRGCC